MALERFSNRDNILATDGKLRANKWTQTLVDKGILNTHVIQTAGTSEFGEFLKDVLSIFLILNELLFVSIIFIFFPRFFNASF